MIDVISDRNNSMSEQLFEQVMEVGRFMLIRLISCNLKIKLLPTHLQK